MRIQSWYVLPKQKRNKKALIWFHVSKVHPFTSIAACKHAFLHKHQSGFFYVCLSKSVLFQGLISSKPLSLWKGCMQQADTITKVSLVFQTLLLFSVGLVFEGRLITAQMDIRFSHYISSCGYRSIKKAWRGSWSLSLTMIGESFFLFSLVLILW